MNKQLILIGGLPGSGKTSLCKLIYRPYIDDTFGRFIYKPLPDIYIYNDIQFLDFYVARQFAGDQPFTHIILHKSYETCKANIINENIITQERLLHLDQWKDGFNPGTQTIIL